MRFSPVIRAHHGRLLQAGERMKAAVTTGLRKLLHIVDATVRASRPQGPPLGCAAWPHRRLPGARASPQLDGLLGVIVVVVRSASRTTSSRCR
jgi:hypothetical protein